MFRRQLKNCLPSIWLSRNATHHRRTIMDKKTTQRILKPLLAAVRRTDKEWDAANRANEKASERYIKADQACADAKDALVEAKRLLTGSAEDWLEDGGWAKVVGWAKAEARAY
jgi:type IV secretory pathway VirD2 relaxase